MQERKKKRKRPHENKTKSWLNSDRSHHVKCVVELRPCEMSDALKTGGGISKFISA